MARLDKTIKTYQEQLKNKEIKNIPDFVQSILDADITKGKYSRFLLDCFLDDKFREEDLKGGLESIIGKTISLFHKHKSKIPEDKRSIYQYDSPGSLWNAVKQFDGELSGREIKQSEQDRIYAETEFVYEDKDSGFKIISPLTEEAAKWWGKGTRWCTSADNNNMFNNYAEDAPLLILLMPASASTVRGDEKLQLWKNDGDIQFMDEADDDVELHYIEKHWDILEPIIKWIGDLKYIPERFKTEEMCKLAVEQNGMNLQFVPNHFITEELCERSIAQNKEAFKYIPEQYRTKFIYKTVAQKNNLSFKQIPQNFSTEDFCKLIVQQNGKALCFIPKDMITEEMCKIAVQQHGEALNYVPEQYRTEKICKIALQNNKYAFRHIPLKIMTEDICKIVIQKDAGFLCYVPKDMRTKEICRLAVEQKGWALNYVPEHLKTEELCKIAVEKDGYALQYVPEVLKKEKLCQLAVQQNVISLQYVPEEWQEHMKQYFKPATIPEEKYQQVFSEIRSCFPEKTLPLTM